MRLSIVTINYNNKDGLLETIESIKKQNDVDDHIVEFIVVDGDSLDGSKELIRHYRKNFTKVLIERDHGIADAFNKGIDLAEGDYIFFLNSGDIFENDDSIRMILEYLSTSNADVFVHKIHMISSYGKEGIYYGKPFKMSKQYFRNYFPHQGMIIAKSMFIRFGNYDTTFRLGMDYEWTLRFLQLKPNIVFHDYPICKMITGGVSHTQFVKTFLAYHKARQKHKRLPLPVSLLISYFFIFKRYCGNLLRKILNVFRK